MLVLPAILLFSCSRNGPSTYQGYVEGEFVHVASGVGGRLEHLSVERGQKVEAKAALFDLESDQEQAAVRQADEALSAAGSQLADLGKGRRRQEIEVSQSQLEQARAAERQSASQLERDEAQFAAGGISRMQLDEIRAKHDVDAARVRELSGRIQVEELTARPDQIRAQSSQVAAAQAARDQAQWRLDQKHVVAEQAGVIVDTLFREGEWVPAGAPVIRMLPPANVKLRFFVPEGRLKDFPVGREVAVSCDGCDAGITAAVSYVATDPEFTPPVIYSNENRAKLVFMIEARPAPDRAALLRPGQPVEITLR
ncbi:MAG TPA: HlyD family efflux transporter periplasmic adaptor subunit [Candidatus Polarisedimenticolia bacterium]|nr:HlyD family efflux transporter periplasmic adaptor subunit [Candidatus Polarisedimenticolia bacterium]